MNFNKTQQKKIEEFESFLGCDPLKALLEESGLRESALRQAYQLHLLTNKKPRSTGGTKKTSAPKAPAVQCMACCWNPGNPLASKQCGKAGTEMVDGVHVCRQHAQDFVGTYKGSGKTAESHPFYCQGCSKDLGQDVFHRDIKGVHCMGTVCGTIKPVCFSKARAHTDYTDSIAKVTSGAVKIFERVESDHEEEDEEEEVVEEEESDHQSQPSTPSSVEKLTVDVVEAQLGEWEQLTLDLENGDGEQKYWTRSRPDGKINVYANEEEEEDREFIDEVEVEIDDEDEEDDE
jgi:hypothetical protein